MNKPFFRLNLIQRLRLSLLEGRYRRARAWSNIELRRIAPLFSGKVINVSGWHDEDKEGGHYSDYFTNKDEYQISNYRGRSGLNAGEEGLFIDLSKPIQEELKAKFDVVLNHTTLEHIFNIFQAFENLCIMSKDIIILIVPFMQPVHDINADYKDYWRMTPFTIEELFEKNNMKVIYRSSQYMRNTSVYYLFIASKHPEKWKGRFNLTELKQLNWGNSLFRINYLAYGLQWLRERLAMHE